MKKLYIIANWKSNKTEEEAIRWLEEFKSYNLNFPNKEVIICPPFTLLSGLKTHFSDNKVPFIKLGSQNVSPFDEGSYTGEVNARQVKEYAQYVIIGHSERRKNFSENEEAVNQKINQALKFNLKTIVCVSSIEQAKTIEDFSGNANLIVAYEPIFAIGTGIPDSPENANKMAKDIKDILSRTPVLYGGSVTSKNINAFTKMPNIDGVLVGKASLSPKEFYALVENA